MSDHRAIADAARQRRQKAQLGELGTAALDYARRGWRVFPCHGVIARVCSCSNRSCDRQGKHPRTRHGLKNATTDEAQIHEWWRRWPGANVAIATGKDSGLVVLDVDSYKSGTEERLGALGELPDTVEVVTGGGGRQLYFQHPGENVKSASDRFGTGLDMKGDGGYVIAPPSLHASGQRYCWKNPDTTELASFPACLNGSTPTTRSAARSPSSSPASRHKTLLRQTWLDRCRPRPEEETLVRALESEAGRQLVAEGRRSEVERMVTDAYAKTVPMDFHLTDCGNAERFVRDHGSIARFCHPWKRWLVWSGTHWQKDRDGEPLRLARQTVRGMYAQVTQIDDAKRRGELAKHAIQSEKADRLRAMLSLAESESEVAITDTVLDTDPWLLTVENGTVDLRTCELREHRQSDMLTHCLPVAYDPEAKCPRWWEFLARVLDGDTDLGDFVQRAVGYSLTGCTREQVFFLAHGSGANGKTTFLETLKALFGRLAQSARFETFLIRRGERIPNDVARMRGARFVTAIEAEGERRLSESTIKELTGGDTVTARFMLAEFFDFQPTHKLWLATNHRPMIRGTDLAIWRRVKLIPFQVTIPEAEQDRDLGHKLREEHPGILAWAVEGCRQWLEKGLGTCSAVEEHTQAYREEQDVLGQFIADECDLGPDCRIKKSDLYKRYREWAEAAGEKFPLTGMAFSLRLQERNQEIRERRSGSTRWWIGISKKHEPSMF